MKSKWYTNQVDGSAQGAFMEERLQRSKKRLEEIAQGVELQPADDDGIIIGNSLGKPFGKLRNNI